MREFVERAFRQVGRPIVWSGEGIEEKGLDKASGSVMVEVDPRYFRPTEVDLLVGDASKARKKLGWQKQTSFDALIKEMIEADLNAVARDGNRWTQHE